MKRIKTGLIFLSLIFFIVISCSSTSKKITLIGKWKGYKKEHVKILDNTILKEGLSFSEWEIGKTQIEMVKGDPVDYLLKNDSLIYIKGVPYYKIEKLTHDELVIIDMQCGTVEWELCTRTYFKRVKKFEGE